MFHVLSHCTRSCGVCSQGFKKGFEKFRSSYGDGVYQLQVLVSLFKYSLINLKSRIQIVRTFVIFLKYPLEFPNTTRRSEYKLKGEGEQRDLELRPPLLAAKLNSNVSSIIPYSDLLDTWFSYP